MSSLSSMLLDDIERLLLQLQDKERHNVFTGPRLIEITKNFGDEVGEQVKYKTYTEAKGCSRKVILSENVNKFSDKSKVNFFEGLLNYSEVKHDVELVDQINILVRSYYSDKTTEVFGAHFLERYNSKISNAWQDACKNFDKGQYRDAADNSRLTLELLLKKICNNNRSLENNIKALGSFLKKCGVKPEFCNVIVQIVKIYTNIQNNFVKHNGPDELLREETSCLMNMTVVFIKFIDQIFMKVERDE